MKVITEEVLMQCIEEVGEYGVICAASLVNLLEEIDILTVTKLRPMSDAPKNGCSFLFVFNGSTRMHEAYLDSLGNLWSGDQFYTLDLCAGWRHMPIYKPEKE